MQGMEVCKSRQVHDYLSVECSSKVPAVGSHCLSETSTWKCANSFTCCSKSCLIFTKSYLPHYSLFIIIILYYSLDSYSSFSIHRQPACCRAPTIHPCFFLFVFAAKLALRGYWTTPQAWWKNNIPWIAYAAVNISAKLWTLVRCSQVECKFTFFGNFLFNRILLLTRFRATSTCHISPSSRFSYS